MHGNVQRAIQNNSLYSFSSLQASKGKYHDFLNIPLFSPMYLIAAVEILRGRWGKVHEDSPSFPDIIYSQESSGISCPAQQWGAEIRLPRDSPRPIGDAPSLVHPLQIPAPLSLAWWGPFPGFHVNQNDTSSVHQYFKNPS